MTLSKNKVDQLGSSPASVFHTPPTTQVPPIFDEESWVCPASEKSLRTTNPIRAIVDPIVASSLGHERKDGKDHISLAVSSALHGYSMTRGNNFLTFRFSSAGRSYSQWTPSTLPSGD